MVVRGQPLVTAMNITTYCLGIIRGVTFTHTTRINTGPTLLFNSLGLVRSIVVEDLYTKPGIIARNSFLKRH
jgi:hypothetical protein